jgi:hypothetical protein
VYAYPAPYVYSYPTPVVAYRPAPVVAYRPAAVYARPVVVRAKVYVPGRPIRNAVRAVLP